MRKKKRGKNHLLHRIKQHRGFVTILLLLIVIALAVLLSGALFGPKNAPGTGGPLTSNYLCCDSGDGDACKPLEEKKVVWKGTNSKPEEYALIKSGVALLERSGHLAEGEPTTTGERVFMNTSDTTADYSESPGCEKGKDLVFQGNHCQGILNDEVIYVCKSECTGNVGTGKFDAYFRLSDIPNPDVPEVIKNCTKPSGTAGQELGQPTIVMEKQPERENLQLQTFKVIQTPVSIPWLSPYCKPAVYLYPEQTSLINVKVGSSEPLTFTDPLYPQGGWNVLADSTGILNYQNKIYDYLYYETKVADSSFEKPQTGFVVEKNELSNLFAKILPKLGLNSKESKQFSDYWLKALPNSPFYFVGIVPQTTLNSLTSLIVNPRPATEIRVTLYFEPIEQKTTVDEPSIVTPKRTGFTIVEWGGIFKKNKDSNFSCFQ